MLGFISKRYILSNFPYRSSKIWNNNIGRLTAHKARRKLRILGSRRSKNKSMGGKTTERNRTQSSHRDNLKNILSNCSNALIRDTTKPYMSHTLGANTLNHNSSKFTWVTICLEWQSKDSFELSEGKHENKVIPEEVVKKHRRVLFSITNKQKETEEYLMDRYEIAAQNHINAFDKTIKHFKSKIVRENVGRITLREISKRIEQFKINKSRRLKERDGLI